MKYVSNRQKAEEQIGAMVQAKLVNIAREYEEIVQGMMREPKTGRKYKASKTGPAHRASAPGEAPAIWMGFLTKGVRHVIEKLDRLRYRIRIGVTIQSGRGGPTGATGKSIAEDLELGTSKMEPRPMWRPALAALRERMALRR